MLMSYELRVEDRVPDQDIEDERMYKIRSKLAWFILILNL